MIDNLKTFHIVPNNLYKTINLISFFQIVNILARKIKGETFELNRPLMIGIRYVNMSHGWGVLYSDKQWSYFEYHTVLLSAVGFFVIPAIVWSGKTILFEFQIY